ncbi:MAG: DUF1642 domain-containing protein [Lactococcus lactis]|jgi:hypothetical protein|uniref:DUF1642 domain-containing protein n=1 Tax=Lactococcus lactis TaxID=1358 RepID=UPI00264C319F|nr:DUF1642 domain-containing protein [Lactococcus lactis]MDN6255564.1 DUF1642 domain-containing protein [Tetragenococcus koreensis]MDN5439429.1 DUF1642 domain-containing protein [Lactococcus lactis]MDN6011530.1 DUF1642 domain-containing protein [Lactococcus lactis]MDN6098166.1 DUF1642 domain-containing protein [Lactococcus lactis]
MTKFEEEVKRPDNGPITELNNSMHSVLSQYRKMRQYADYLEYELKQKDEHILKLENENSFMRDERTTFDSNGMAVEPKLQQQALPVVPECVAEWIECVKGKNKNALALLDDDNMPDDVNEWLFFQRNDDNINLILRAWLDGYTVEKPQLFYLKHIDMSKSDAHLNWYLAKGTDNVLIHQGIKKGKSPKLKCILKLTQQEIGSMQTGSYEQIEVTE